MTKKQEKQEHIEPTPRPLADITAEIAQVKQQQADMTARRAELEHALSKDINGASTELTEQIGRLDILLGAASRRLQWLGDEQYGALVEDAIAGYEKVRADVAAASLVSSQAHAAQRGLHEVIKKMQQEADHAVLQATGRLHMLQQVAVGYLANRALELPKERAEQFLVDVRERSAAIDAGYQAQRRAVKAAIRAESDAKVHTRTPQPTPQPTPASSILEAAAANAIALRERLQEYVKGRNQAVATATPAAEDNHDG